MGMDVYGRKPKNEVGSYFRRNVWGWHPLWSYCESLHEELVSSCEDGHSNSGFGLNNSKSIKLAKAIKEDIRSKRADLYIEERDSYLQNLPDEDCAYCDANGERTLQKDDTQLLKKCNVCSGKKTVRPFATYYFLTVQDLKEFAEFLENCGGFNIH